MSEAATLRKLIVLYILEQVSYPLTNGQLTEFILTKEYMDYFSLQETLTGLLNAELIDAHQENNRTAYLINDAGRETLSFFRDRISDAIRDDVRLFLIDGACDLRYSNSAYAAIEQNPSGEYDVHCRIVESGATLFRLTLTVPTRMQAETAAIHWKERYLELYGEVMTKLL